jgi:hypothetical protein
MKTYKEEENNLYELEAISTVLNMFDQWNTSITKRRHEMLKNHKRDENSYELA